MNFDQLFFELIQVALGVRICLSRTPNDVEWKSLYDMAKKQSLVGVCFAGVQRLQQQRQEPIEMLYLTWMGMAAKIQQRNEVINKQCVELQEKLANVGIRSSILKGQAVGQYYNPTSSAQVQSLATLRQSGDIDTYVGCGRARAIEYARTIQDQVEWDYKHLHLNVFQDTEVEMHYVPEVFLNLRKNRKLQKWFKEHQEQIFTSSTSSVIESVELITPSVEFNLFYILLHTYRHFLYEGVGMRQLMDYYFVLQTNGSKGKDGIESKERALAVIKEFGMSKFASGVMWIMNEVFGLEDKYLLCEPDEKEGRYILNEVMKGGNFGHHDERLKDNKTTGKKRAIKKILKHNMHLLTHYPADTLWAPMWIVYHWCWKRMNRI